MDGLKNKKYLLTAKKHFDPLALFLSTTGIAAIFFSVMGLESARALADAQSLIIVVGGTLAILLFQFDLSSTALAFVHVFRSFLGTPERSLLQVMSQLDSAIIQGQRIFELREGTKLTGDLLNDVIYMHHQGLVFSEIDAFITARIADAYLGRSIAVSLLSRGATIAPSLGLFGTVMGLIGVLKSLENPAKLGPSMSLALMTTAYGAILGTLIFTPLAGRLEHHNQIFLEVHKQLLSKVGILLERENRTLDHGIGEASA